jgi:hypothetical protein
LIEALNLEDVLDALAADLEPLKQEANAAIYAIELESSIGPTAFLTYVYHLDRRGDDGRSGRQLFDADLATLQQAASHDSPGPRVLAHAFVGDDGFILATTPATFRALTGQGHVGSLEATASILPSAVDTVEARRTAAGELLQILRSAESQATTWLTAIQSEGHRDDDAELDFTPEETELALFLLDDKSIKQLLRVLNLLISAARESAAGTSRDDADA